MRFALVLAIAACGGSGVSNARRDVTQDDHAYLAGVWTSSTKSFDDAKSATTAVQLGREGTLANGDFASGKFTPVPPRGGFIPHFEINAGAHEIHFFLDGAEETAAYELQPPDRWSTKTADATVFYVRR
jgi:hypothetical protein